MNFNTLFSRLNNFTLPDFWQDFSVPDVLNLSKNWQFPEPTWSFLPNFDFSPADLNDSLQSYVSDLTGIELADIPYQIETLVTDLDGTVTNLVETLTVNNLAQITYSGNPSVDALLDNSINWNYLSPARNVLYYSFDIKNFTDSNLRTPVTAFNTLQQEATRSILAHASQVTGIKFAEVATTKEADIHFANTDLVGKQTAGLSNNSYSYRYNGKEEVTSYSADSYIYLDNVEWNKENSNPVAGTQGYETLLHEIGHALGLKHSFESPNKLPPDEDNTNNTVMSYTHKGGYKTEFQSYDLAALKWIYGDDGLGGVSYSSVKIAQTPQGTDKDDLLIGTSKAERIEGFAGNDTLNGGAGRDTLIGGDGNDLYIIDNVSDRIIETNSIDIDSVQSSVSYTLPKNVENLILTGKAKNAVGNELGNKLVGNDLANTLNGMAGNDTLEGGKGNDRLTGGRGEDTFVFNMRDYDFMGDFAPRAQNLDTITDFKKGEDLIQLSAAFAFKGFAVTNNIKTFSGAESLIYDSATRALYFDADGAETRYTPTAFIKFSGRVNLDESDLQFINEIVV